MAEDRTPAPRTAALRAAYGARDVGDAMCGQTLAIIYVGDQLDRIADAIEAMPVTLQSIADAVPYAGKADA